MVVPLIADDEVHVGLWFPGSFSHFLIGIKRVGCLDVSLFSPFPFSSRRLHDYNTLPCFAYSTTLLGVRWMHGWSNVAFGIYGVLRGGRGI